MSYGSSRPAAASAKGSAVRRDDPILLFKEEYRSNKTVPQHRAPPNRFNILPGPKWDGVDRSNGFEIRYFKKQAESKARKELDYKYTVADM